MHKNRLSHILFLILATLICSDAILIHAVQKRPTHMARRSSPAKPSREVQQRLAIERVRIRDSIRKEFYKNSRKASVKKSPSRPIKRKRTQTKRSARKRTPQRTPSKKVFRWPVHPKNFWLSSYYGPRTVKGRKGFHSGIDLAATTGTRVSAAASGKVIEARYLSGYGKCIVIAHANRYKTRYAHLSRIVVRVGQRVKCGQLIGKVGATGHVSKNKTSRSASHLHFEVYRNGKRVNPSRYLG